VTAVHEVALWTRAQLIEGVSFHPSFRRAPESGRVLNLNWKCTWMPVFTGMTKSHFAVSIPEARSKGEVIFVTPERDISSPPA